MKPRFENLNPLEGLQAAIAIERRNTELYQNLTQLFQSYDGKLAEVFAAMAEEEVSHRLELEAFLQKQFPGEPPNVKIDPEIEEGVEAPDLEEPEVFVFDNVSPEQAIEMAERAETHAYTFYQTMAGKVKDPGLQAICRRMAEIEAEHKETFVRWKQPGAAAEPRRLPARGNS